jgi:molybdopterin molybdotransferase
MISPAEAEAAIRAAVGIYPSIVERLEDLVGAVLREPIRATRDQPPFDRVTMDGIAFAHAAYAQGRRSFRIVGTQAAGAPPRKLEDPSTCIEVMTGAVVPQGCDCVIPVEKISVSDGVASVSEDASVIAGLNIHGCGIDSRAGDPLLAAGTYLGPAEIAVIASAGLTEAVVSKRPRIVVISTGDELVQPGHPIEGWQIYRSNVYAVLAALRNRGYAHLAHDHLADDLPTLRTRLAAHLEHHDAMILSGGVSMGRFDYVPQVLQELGVKPVFHKIAQRPGKPMWFGVGKAGQCVYALPGNPVSTLVCLARYVFAGLAAAQGRPIATCEFAALDTDFEVKPALTFFLPVSLHWQGSSLLAQPRPTKGSGDFTSLVGTDGFVELPPGPQVVSKATPLPLYRW